jgi:hypothetical protein
MVDELEGERVGTALEFCFSAAALPSPGGNLSLRCCVVLWKNHATIIEVAIDRRDAQTARNGEKRTCWPCPCPSRGSGAVVAPSERTARENQKTRKCVSVRRNCMNGFPVHLAFHSKEEIGR